VNHFLTLATALFAATSKTKTSGSSVTFLIFIVVIVGALYFLFLRPNQQRAKRQREENSSIGVGDKVVSIGGIVGVIEEVQGDRVVLLSSNPGIDTDNVRPTRLVLLRTAIARKVDPGTIEPEPEPAEDDEPAADPEPSDEHHEGGDPGKADKKKWWPGSEEGTGE
jgi:preprotein translocase subunit YajC